MDGFYEKGYNLALENLYTSPELLLHYTSMALMHMKLCVFEEPPMIKFFDTFMVCRWNDAYKTKSTTKIVSRMSTKHTGQLADTGSKHYANKQNILKPPDVMSGIQ